jgi:hypothetical protein
MRRALACLLLIAAPAWAATKAAKPAAPVSTTASLTKPEKIRVLISVTGADQQGLAMLEQLKARMPPAQYEKMKLMMTPENMVEVLSPIYDRHFTAEELDQLIAFYQTPLGAKLLREMPAIAAESAQAGQELARRKLTDGQQPARADVPAR